MNEQSCQREIATLRQSIADSLALAKRCTSKTRIREDDDFAFMALSYLCKQMDHAESLLALIPRRDTCLIARTMFDGQCQLFWAANHPHERGCQWRAFSLVHDWRLMQTQLAQGKKVDPVDDRRITNGLVEFGHLFKKKAESSKERDPYHKNWRAGLTLAKMASESGLASQYDDFYGPMSDWEHWGPGGIGVALSRSDDLVTFSSESSRACVVSLLVGLECLLNTIEVVDRHLHLSMNHAVVEIRDTCQAKLKVHTDSINIK